MFICKKTTALILKLELIEIEKKRSYSYTRQSMAGILSPKKVQVTREWSPPENICFIINEDASKFSEISVSIKGCPLGDT